MKNTYYKRWIENTVPEIAEEYNIHKGKGIQTDAKRIASLLTDSFLEHIPIPKQQNITMAAEKLNRHLYNLAYENKLVCDPIPKETVRSGRSLISLHAGYRKKPETYDKVAINIIEKIME